MKFRDYFNNDFETTEDHYLPELKTRYYRCSKEKAQEVVKGLVDHENAQIKDVVEQYNEVFFQGPNYTCIITIITTRIAETAIDIKITTYKLLPRGFGVKIINRMYKYLDSKLPYKGVGLYRE